MSLRRRFAKVFAVVVGLYLLAPALGFGEYLGSDPFVNIGPTEGLAGLAGRYPLDAYTLDYHVDFGVTNPGGIVPELRQAVVQQGWDLISNALNLIIEIFTWAFSLELITGSHGVLPTIAAAMQNFEQNLISAGWMYFAIVCAGIWGMWRALVQRRAGEVFGAFALSLACTILCMVIISNPVTIIGGAVKFANGASTSFLNGFGAVGKSGESPSTTISDHIFDTMIYKPWVVLEFGGLTHCVDTRRQSPEDNDYPLSVKPGDPTANVCRDSIKQNANGYGGYAKFFLEQAPGTDARNEEYDALRRGEVPTDPKYAAQFRGRKIDKNDSPAVDIQQADGALGRVRTIFLVGLGAIAVFLLFGRLAVTVIVAQILALALLGLAPVALIAGIFPGGVNLLKWWATRMATALFIKVIYAIVIAVLMGTSAALLVSTEWAGFMISFGIQTIFFWAVYLKRKLIVNELAKAVNGGSGHVSAGGAALTAAGVYAAMRPVRSMLRGKQGGNGSGPGSNAGKGKDDDVVEDEDATLDTSKTGDKAPDTVPVEWEEESSHGAVKRGAKRQANRSKKKNGNRSYRYATDEELEALNGGGDPDSVGGDGASRVAWALVGTEKDPKPKGVPQGGSEKRNDDSAPDDPTPSEAPTPARRPEGKSPRELHEEAVGRLVKTKRKRKVRVESDHDESIEDDSDVVDEDEEV